MKINISCSWVCHNITFHHKITAKNINGNDAAGTFGEDVEETMSPWGKLIYEFAFLNLFSDDSVNRVSL